MRLTSYVAASAIAALTTAQTFTDCNPMEKKCPNNPAMPATFETNFKAGKDAVKGWKQTAGSLTYGDSGAEFTVAKKGDAPTIQSEGYLHFGYIEVKCKAAPGQGIISSIVLQSDNLDEVDWEYIGGVDNKAQMNYFGKGNTTTYDRMIEADVATTQNEMHTYALNWTAESLTWIIDENPVRTLNFGDANGGKNYPQTPSNVRIGIWAGGDSDNEGTREWAGGPVDYSQAPFTMTVESVKVTSYSPGTEYKWADKSGSWESIEVIDEGNETGAPENSKVIQPSASVSGDAIGGSNYSAPTATGQPQEGDNPAETGVPAESTPCSEGEDAPGATPAPSEAPATTSSPEEPVESPCDCGVATVTVTGTAPPAGEQPPAESSAQPEQPSGPSPPEESVVESSAQPEQPPVTVPASSAPPYPTTTPGLVTDTMPAPSVPLPSAPSGIVPSNTTAPPPDFTGAASHHKASALLGAIGAVVLFL